MPVFALWDKVQPRSHRANVEDAAQYSAATAKYLFDRVSPSDVGIRHSCLKSVTISHNEIGQLTNSTTTKGSTAVAMAIKGAEGGSMTTAMTDPSAVPGDAAFTVGVSRMSLAADLCCSYAVASSGSTPLSPSNGDTVAATAHEQIPVGYKVCHTAKWVRTA